MQQNKRLLESLIFLLDTLPSSLLDELSIDERDSDGFISRVIVCSSSDSSTDSSQITVGYQLRFLALFCTRSADLACTWYYYLIACNPY